ncbi:N-acetylmuramoyl-L-alanine amidase [Vallitalea pronyensis]|uniref:N-acetylmuramoyl-L-alanine amidase n=1 Tax=Vallitalea pronyensis TaxID=1348613 RepID=A0A8J8MP93_9FIRM|nr:peptidoglycan recognition family protein [Vallitalea pronyensis]QUI24863.1 N-acetylmuramoyl-L-alanine amidase [Vallitalea pronyensis]
MKIIDSKLKINVPSNNKPLYIIVHHALKSSCSIYDIHKWHIGFGWAGCGYHFFVTKEGKIYRGRREEQRGAHCKGMNSKSLGICLEGCYQDYKGMADKSMPQAQFNALVWLTKQVQTKYNIPIDKVKKHHDYASYKLCPGNYVPWDNYITALRESNDNELEVENEQLRQTIEGLRADVEYLNDQWKKTSKEVFNLDVENKELNNRIALIKAGLKELGEM